MVSIPDSHSPPPSHSLSSSSSSSSSRIQRSYGHSMRTIRSSLYQTDRNFSSAAENSTAISENLTDSIVDFKLRELTVGVESSSADTTADLLELSYVSSDFSSFNYDISGELLRLASIPGSETPQNHMNPSNMDDPDLLRLGLGVWEKGLFSSSQILESASQENLEPVILTYIGCLQSSSASIQVKRAAAANLRLLAKHRSDFRTLIGSSGAIPALIPLLRSTDPVAQENAVTALLNLSLEESNKVQIAGAGAIKPLVYALRTGTAVAKQNAACALLSLSMIEENRTTIGTCGAIPPLVSLLVHGSIRGKKDALTTLYKLCTAKQNKERAVSAGAVCPLVELVREHRSGTTEKAIVVLSCLAGIPEGRTAIVEEEGIPVLVEAIEEGSEFALHTLLQLCADSARNRGLVLREGAIPPLVALSQCGSARAKQKAETLLAYLREQRHDSESSD